MYALLSIGQILIEGQCHWGIRFRIDGVPGLKTLSSTYHPHKTNWCFAVCNMQRKNPWRMRHIDKFFKMFAVDGKTPPFMAKPLVEGWIIWNLFDLYQNTVIQRKTYKFRSHILKTHQSKKNHTNSGLKFWNSLWCKKVRRSSSEFVGSYVIQNSYVRFRLTIKVFMHFGYWSREFCASVIYFFAWNSLVSCQILRRILWTHVFLTWSSSEFVGVRRSSSEFVGVRRKHVFWWLKWLFTCFGWFCYQTNEIHMICLCCVDLLPNQWNSYDLPLLVWICYQTLQIMMF